MDIICARCGRHFNCIEGAREHTPAECDRIASFDRHFRKTTVGRTKKKTYASAFEVIWDMGAETADEAVERHRKVSENISKDRKIVDDRPPPNPAKDALDEKNAKSWRKRHRRWLLRHGKGTLFK